MVETNFLTKQKTDTEIIKLPDNIQIPLTEGKFCTKCNKFKKLSDYFKNKSKLMGIEASCKECNKPRHKLYYQNNKEKQKKHYQNFLLKNPDYQRNYYKNNKKILNS